MDYNENRRPDPFMTWFRQQDSKGFFQSDYERVLAILIDARFDQRTTAEKALQNTITVVRYGALKKLVKSEELSLLVPKANVTAEKWTKLFCDALPAMNELSARVVAQEHWNSTDLLDLMRGELHVPYLGIKTARLAVRWIHELVPRIKIKMSTYRIPIDSLVYRVCARLGIIDPTIDKYSGEGSPADEKIQRFVESILPDRPWLLDEALWSTGRQPSKGGHCYPSQPNCNGCLFDKTCEKNLLDVDPAKMGIQLSTALRRSKSSCTKKMITEKQAAFARFVNELKQEGIKGKEYRDKIRRWQIESEDSSAS